MVNIYRKNELYFKFGEYDSRNSKEVVVTKLPPLLIQQNEFEIEEIPGRDGFYTYDTGSRAPIEKIVEVKLLSDAGIKELRQHLKGTNWLECKNEPGIIYKARLNSLVQADGEFPNFKTLQLGFMCQPNGFDKATIKEKETTLLSQTVNGYKTYYKDFINTEYYRAYPKFTFRIEAYSFKFKITNDFEDKIERKEMEIITDFPDGINTLIEIDTLNKDVFVNGRLPQWRGEMGFFEGKKSTIEIETDSNVYEFKIAERWCI